ncbi:Vacuolar protein sorting-associated protein 24 homolog 1 [Zea mays]|uniref:Vacuolar protein sorting-associated protein 24 homolog 1 n=1 Tax=Zea mays TaxID=4577 RepID=A0A1D6JKN7_MAIZE|nr:Vacuolar protein sorting-associated protein 24 homolog 1 [Zea mays]
MCCRCAEGGEEGGEGHQGGRQAQRHGIRQGAGHGGGALEEGSQPPVREQGPAQLHLHAPWRNRWY